MSTSDDLRVTGHERRDVRASTVVKWGAGIFGLVLFTVAAMWLVLGRLETREERRSAPASPLASYGPQEPPQPRLQTDARGELDRLRASEREQLDGYGWVDRDAGTVHIPIDKAIGLLVQRRGSGQP
jgi:hypothetical protein